VQLLEFQAANAVNPHIDNMLRLMNSMCIAMQKAPSVSLLKLKRAAILRVLDTETCVCPGVFKFREFAHVASGLIAAAGHSADPSWAPLVRRFNAEIELYETALALVRETVV